MKYKMQQSKFSLPVTATDATSGLVNVEDGAETAQVKVMETDVTEVGDPGL